jgi:hypothetical protein
MAQRDNRHTEMGTWHAPPRRRRYAPLSGAAKYPARARPSKCIIIIGENHAEGSRTDNNERPGRMLFGPSRVPAFDNSHAFQGGFEP